MMDVEVGRYGAAGSVVFVMRVAQVCPRYYPYFGGVETRVQEISERLMHRGFEVEVLTTDSLGTLPKKDKLNDVKIFRFKSWAPNEAYCFSNGLKRFLMKNADRFDIVDAHSYHAFPAFYAAQAKNRNKLVFTPHYHGEAHTFLRKLLHIPYKFLGKSLFRKADRIICVSNYEKSLIMSHFNVCEEEVAVIPNGVCLEEYECLEKRREDSRVILYVGRLEKYKGIQHLIKALPKLGHDIFLEIVGKGPYQESLVELARKLGVENRVKFYKDLPRKDLLQMYVDADLFVLLSTHEAYGIGVAEALASGTPCIVANASALEEWVDDKNCFGINYPIDLNELVCLIDKAIGKKIERASLLSWDKVVEELLKLYEEN